MLNFDKDERNVETFLNVLNVAKKLTRHERNGQWSILARLCCVGGWADGLRALSLEQGFQYKDDYLGASLVHWACWGGDLETCLIALEMGQDVEQKGATHQDKYGLTPMHWAAMMNAEPTLCHALLKEGANPAEKDHWGMIPAHWSNSEAFWAWTMSALWAKGKKLGKISPPEGSGHAEVSESLGNIRAAKWIRWELGVSQKPQKAPSDNWVKTARETLDRIEAQIAIDLGVAKRHTLRFDWRV